MARIYKEVVQGGKKVKKWVEDYITFEFDEEGNITNAVSQYEDIAEEYDEKGNRTNIPWCFENNDTGNEEDDDEYNSSKAIFKSENYDSLKNRNVEKIGNQIFVDDYISWTQRNGMTIQSVDIKDLKEIQKEIDEDNNLIYIKNGNSELFFEYEDNLLVHIRHIKGEDYDEEYDYCTRFDEKWFEYENGLVVYTKDSTGSMEKYEYDSGNHLTYSKKWNDEDDSEDVYETKYKYDGNGNLLERLVVGFNSMADYESGKSRYTEETKYEYDSNGKMTLLEGDDYLTEWDSSGNIIHEINQNGEYKNEYSLDGKLIHSVHTIPKGKEESRWFDYDRNYEKKWDSNGNLIYKCYSSEKEIFEYNSDNKLVYYLKEEKEDEKISKYEEWNEYSNEVKVSSKNSNGEEYRYNEEGKLFFYQDSDHDTYWYEFDAAGNPIHFKDYNCEEWYEYEFFDNGNIKKKNCYHAL